MKLVLFSICVFAILARASLAQECSANYWEVIPLNKKCDTYQLPDFNFSAQAQEPNVAQHIKRFCKYYEVSSKFGKQRTGYCYFGKGDRTGPTFRLGDESWNFSSSNKDKVYFADLNFTGCQNGKAAQGIVFGVYGWNSAPATIERSWPLEGKVAKCIR